MPKTRRSSQLAARKNAGEKPSCRGPCDLCDEVNDLKAMLKRQSTQLNKLLAHQTPAGVDPNAESTVQLDNPNLKDLEVDHLYHLGLDTGTHDFPELFGDVRFVVLGGTMERMQNFAHFVMQQIGYQIHAGASLNNIAEKGHRYVLYKVGPVLIANHGMGTPSLSIVLIELFKLCYYAKVQNPIFFRMGTCGGIGLPAGTVVITEEALDAQLRNELEVVVMGKPTTHPTTLDAELAEELQSLVECSDCFAVATGKTLCADDFYEGQARLDGAFCSYTEADKLKFLEELSEMGVVNMEMESSLFAAYTNRAGVRSAVVCVTLLDRLNGDQIVASPEEKLNWEERPAVLIARYIRNVIHDIRPPGRGEPRASSQSLSRKAEKSRSRSSDHSVSKKSKKSRTSDQSLSKKSERSRTSGQSLSKKSERSRTSGQSLSKKSDQ